MPRSVNAVASRKRRKKILKLAKGYFGRKKNVWTVAKNQVEKGWVYAYRDRKAKKREFRKLWIQRINAGARILGTSYSRLMGALSNSGIALNRKVLADLAMNHPEAFKAVVDMATQSPAKAKSAVPAPEAKVKKAPKAKKEEKSDEKSEVESTVTEPTEEEVQA